MKFEEVKNFVFNELLPGLPEKLSYHSTLHITDVYSAAEEIGRQEHISAYDNTLLLTAVLFHDSGFLVQQKGHEIIGCDYARKYLPLYNYTEAEIEIICGIIMATRIPQTPHTKLEEIICDADLDYLGRDDFFEVSARLYQELTNLGMSFAGSYWNRLQVEFFENHHYFTATSLKTRAPKKAEHLAFIKSKIVN